MIQLGTNLELMHLIQRAYYDVPIYNMIPGGFPQWVYRSCLKGKPLG